MKYIGGFSLGTLIAVALSWSANHSILWAIIHGFCSWFYVIYYFYNLIAGLGIYRTLWINYSAC
jgi:hypothetical protein